MKRTRYALVGMVMLGAAGGLFLAVAPERAFAHKAKHTPEQLQTFEQIFLDQVKIGDMLFHGDATTQKQLGVELSSTGMACAMCHPFASDTHPHEYPKFQEQLGQFAMLRDMINWCIEKPNEGKKIDPESDAMKALEAYIAWSNRGSKLDPGRH